MWELAFQTHRYLLDPVSGGQGFRLQLVKKYLSFISRIMKSPKQVLKQLLHITKNDVRTTTGANLRNILLMTDHSNVNDLKVNSIENIKISEIKSEDKWRVNLIQEVINMKHENLIIPAGWTIPELEELLHLVCVS